MKINELAKLIDARIDGDETKNVDRLASLDEAGPDDISFLNDLRYSTKVADCRAGCVVVPENFEQTVSATVLRVTDVNKAIEILKKLGSIEAKATKDDINSVKERLEFAKRWVRDFASDQYRFEVQKRVDKEVIDALSEKQRKALVLLKQRLVQNEYDDKTLFEEFYRIRDGSGVDIKDFFKGAYRVIINRDRGPRLAPFILQIGKKKVIELLGEISF